MNRITREQKQYVQDKAPWFVELLQAVELQPDVAADSMISVRLAQFRGDITLLYACLWYASSSGVAVRFVPNTRG